MSYDASWEKFSYKNYFQLRNSPSENSLFLWLPQLSHEIDLYNSNLLEIVRFRQEKYVLCPRVNEKQRNGPQKGPSI